MPAGRRIQGYSVGWSSMPEAGSILPAVNGGEHRKIQMVEAFVSVASQGNQVSGTWAIHECQQWLRDLHKVRGTRCLPSSVQLHSMLLRFSCCCTSKVLMKLLVASFFFGPVESRLVFLVFSKILCLRGNAWKFILHPTNIKTMYIC